MHVWFPSPTTTTVNTWPLPSSFVAEGLSLAVFLPVYVLGSQRKRQQRKHHTIVSNATTTAAAAATATDTRPLPSMSGTLDESKDRMRATQSGGDAPLDRTTSAAERQMAELDTPVQRTESVDVKQAREVLDDFESRVNESRAGCVWQRGRGQSS